MGSRLPHKVVSEQEALEGAVMKVALPPWEKSEDVCRVLLLQRILEIIWPKRPGVEMFSLAHLLQWLTRFYLDVLLIVRDRHPWEMVTG